MSVKYALLSLLYRRPCHGYELRERFELSLGQHWDLNPGQIYLTLERLEREGLVNHEIVTQDTGPDKKVYRLTPQGEQELQRWFTHPIDRGERLRDELYVKLLMGLLTSAIPAEEIIAAQRQGLLRELHRVTLQRAQCDWGQDTPTLLLLDSAILHLEADLHWLSLYETRLNALKAHTWPEPHPRPRGRPPRSTDIKQGEG